MALVPLYNVVIERTFSACRQGWEIMKKCFFITCICILFCSLIGCNSGDDSDQVNLDSYSAIDHSFLNSMMDDFRTEENVVTLTSGAEAPVGGAVAGSFKLFGKVAQIAGKVHTIQAANDFRSSVLSDLNGIKSGLKDIDTKITNGFNAIHAKLDSNAFANIWNQLANPHLVNIDNAWKYYLDEAPGNRYSLGLLNKLSVRDPTVEVFEKAVNEFNIAIEPKMDNIDVALTAIQSQITGYGVNLTSKILDLYVTALSSNNGTTFDSEILMEDVLTQYLYMYSNLLLYQTKALILMAEYYNYKVIDESDQINLDPTGYTTVTSDRSKAMNRNAIYEFKKQLVPFLNSGERLISQFNSGDIYREYGDRDTPIKNSDFYPYIDSYIKTFYGGDFIYNLFVFRLVWSEEAATNDPDAENQYKEVSGPYNYNYKALFDDLKDPNKKLHFYLDENTHRASRYYPIIHPNVAKNLTGISTFTLHPQGYVDKEFNAGLRRFVFIRLPSGLNLKLNYTTDLTESYRFNYTPEGTKVAYFKLYEPKSVEFKMLNLLLDQNPLRSINYKYSCLSYTFGAYMAEFEYKNKFMLPKVGKKSSDVSYLYNASSDDRYKMNYPADGYAYSELKRFSKANNAKYAVGSYDETEVYDGLGVVLFGYDTDRSTPMTFGVGKYATGEKLRSNGREKNFTIKKKYIFPSGKLFSDDVIKKDTFFMLTRNKGDDNRNDNLWVSQQVGKHSSIPSLELSKDGDFSMKTWFFLDDKTETVHY